MRQTVLSQCDMPWKAARSDAAYHCAGPCEAHARARARAPMATHFVVSSSGGRKEDRRGEAGARRGEAGAR
eukprot:2609030-Pleurochrysis_carterae.AAC.1